MISLRSAEYHTVLAEGGLPMHAHADYGSLVTMDLMLSDTSEFEGGVFQTREEDGELLSHTFERGDALVFLSHKHHGVSAVTAGRRNIMVCEFWEACRGRVQRCDQPWMPCYRKYRFDTAMYVDHDPARYTPMRGPTDMERLRLNGLAEHRRLEAARAAAEAEERAAAQARARAERALGASSSASGRRRPTPPPRTPRRRPRRRRPAARSRPRAADARARRRRRGRAGGAGPRDAAAAAREVEAAAIDPIEQQHRFREIRHRQRLRWDLQLSPDDEPAWAELRDAAVAAATPAVAAAQGDAFRGPLEVVQVGLVVSRTARACSASTSTPRTPTSRPRPPTPATASTTSSCRSSTSRRRTTARSSGRRQSSTRARARSRGT